MRATTLVALTGLLLMATACSSEHADGPGDSPPENTGSDAIDEELRESVLQLIDDHGITPLDDLDPQDPARVELGQKLFFDPVLSGPQDVNCATCHQMDQATVDELSLSAGTGFTIDEHGDRRSGPQASFTTRTSIELFNRGHDDWHTFQWDGRLQRLEDDDGQTKFVIHERSYPYMPGNYVRTLDGSDNLLAAQAHMPVHSRDEMRGYHEFNTIDGSSNTMGSIADHYFDGTWNHLMRRLHDIPDYIDLFHSAYPDTDPDDLSFTHAANALAAFMIEAFSFSDSPFNRFLHGDEDALTNAELRGAELFYGDAGCASCHGDTLMTDQQFYNIAVPPMTSGPESLQNMDLGAAHRSHAGSEKSFTFRTPPLHNVAHTDPYMHNGAYFTLEEVIRHKVDPLDSLWNYDRSHLPPSIFVQVHTRADELQRVEDHLSPEALETPALTDEEIDDLVAFLHALSSPQVDELDQWDVHEAPSGLPMPDLSEPSPILDAEN